MAYVLDIAALFGVFVILVISLNYLVGNVGVLYVGHIAFFAIGSYSSAVLSQKVGLHPLLAMTFGIVLTAIFSLALGTVTVRLAGHYLLMASLGMCEIVRSALNNSQFVGGAEGTLAPGYLFSSDVGSPRLQIYLTIFLFVILQLVFFYLLDRSPKGRAFRAVRDDETLLLTVGRSVSRLKVQALVISASWASVAGSLFAHYFRYIDPSSFTVMDSLMLLIAIMVGGVGSFTGSVLACGLIIVFPAAIRLIELPATIVGPLHKILFAITLLLILKFKPKGLKGDVLLP